MIKEIKRKYIELYNAEPKCFRSPGRINIIGEHTDYNMGFVLPAAIDKSIYFAISPNSLCKFRLFAFDLNEYMELSEIKPSNHQWANYLIGVIDGFQKQGVKIPNFDLVFGGDLPNGAGFSSSAAIEVGLAYALNSIFELNRSQMQLILLAQQAEHNFVGVKCGIMDQFAVMFGKENKLIQLDCRSLDYEYHTFDIQDFQFVFADTGVKHNLAENEYNLRREQCESGVKILQQKGYKINSLRDVNIELLDVYKSEMSEIIYQRCSYVIEENIRLHKTIAFMTLKDWESFGEMLYASHQGLSIKYEVSCEELDVLVESTKNLKYVLGARMMGGGFGGCTINLVKTEFIPEFKEQLQNIYFDKFKKPLKIYEMRISNGVSAC